MLIWRESRSRSPIIIRMSEFNFYFGDFFGLVLFRCFLDALYAEY